MLAEPFSDSKGAQHCWPSKLNAGTSNRQNNTVSVIQQFSTPYGQFSQLHPWGLPAEECDQVT